MRFRLDDKIKMPRNLIVLLALVFVVWTAGASALPVYGDTSASSLLVGEYSVTEPSSDPSSPADDSPLQRFTAEYSQLTLTSCALEQLAFHGPRLRLLSYPCLPQAPPSTL